MASATLAGPVIIGQGAKIRSRSVTIGPTSIVYNVVINGGALVSRSAERRRSAIAERARRLLSGPEGDAVGARGQQRTSRSSPCRAAAGAPRRGGDDHEPAAQAILALIARELGITLVVTRDAYRTADRSSQRDFDDDIHLTAQGAKTLADLLDRASPRSLVRR